MITPPRGGTEILHEHLLKHVDNNLLSNVNLMVSVCDSRLLHDSKPNILWQHVNTDQKVAHGLRDYGFVNSVEKFIYVSEWQRKKYHNDFDLPYDRSTVLLNAIEPIQFIPKPKNKIKLIYTSTPWRGLEILLESFKLLNRDDVELDVYSSTVIYGSNFIPNHYDWLFNKCRATKNVNYKGYALNKGVRRALQQAHIFAYPSIFEETSCLAAIEAGAAGCKIVTTDYGALTETCGDYAVYTRHTNDFNKLIHDYAEILNNAIENYSEENLVDQSNYFNNRYSWYNRKNQWMELLKNYA